MPEEAGGDWPRIALILSTMPYESIPPMVIIAVGVAAMGALPGAVSYVWAGWKVSTHLC